MKEHIAAFLTHPFCTLRVILKGARPRASSDGSRRSDARLQPGVRAEHIVLTYRRPPGGAVQAYDAASSRSWPEPALPTASQPQ